MRRWLHSIAIPVAGVIVMGTVATQTWAGEEFRGRGMLTSTAFNKVDVPDEEDHALMHGADDGVIFNETGGEFLDNARYQVFWMLDKLGSGDGKVQGYKVFTMADDSKVFARFEGKPGSASSDGRARGTWTLTGGTGKYEGVKGHGNFTYTPITDTVAWDLLEGEVELP